MKTKQSRRSKLEGVAYHEAGHAVVGYQYGWRLRAVSIRSQGRLLGSTRWYRQRTCLMHEAVTLMAGPAAEARYWGRRKGHHAIGDELDLADLVEYSGRGDEIRWEQQKTLFRKIAKQRVEWLWPVIQALAAELLKVGRLSGPKAEAIIEPLYRRLLEQSCKEAV